MKRNTIICGDVIGTLQAFPDDCIDCVVTSPPYWGLRDYGTGKWEGGDANCPHHPDRTSPKSTLVGTTTSQEQSILFKDICRLCGARRVDNQIGLEPTLEEYLQRLTRVFNEVKRVLKPDGTLWLNLGDSYNAYNGGAGSSSKLSKTQSEQRPDLPTGYGLRSKALKPKDLLGQPWRLAFALQADGWYLRSDIIWSKPNPMPESVTDRPTKAHEYVFLMSKQPRYYYDADAVRENAQYGRREHTGEMRSVAQDGRRHTTGTTKGSNPESGRNRRTVWEIATQPMPDAHFATFPEKLVEPCILAGTSERGYCSECGRPWGRVVERSFIPQPDVGRERGVKGAEGQKPTYGNGWDGVPRGSNQSNTIGWRPTCACYDDLYRTEYAKAKSKRKSWQQDASGNWWRRVKRRPGHDHWKTVPGLVLDPFIGSGTVALVAHRLDRDFIGIELSAEYCEIAHKRIDEETSQGRLFAGG